MNRLYFFRLYKHNRILFYGVFSFTLITIICNLRGFEITPFFVWGMYSDKEAQPAYYEVQKIIVNDTIIIDNTRGFTASARFLINSPLWYYMSIKNNQGIDPTIRFLQLKLHNHYSLIKPYESLLFNDSTRLHAFVPWCKQYLEEVTGININHLQVINIQVHYVQQKIVTDTSYSIAEWKQ